MFWNTFSLVYDFVENTFNGKVNRSIVNYVANLIDSNDNVLECACGTGIFSVKIAPCCKTLIATDFAEKMLRKARKKCKDFSNVKFANADITMLDYSDESFDKVLAANVIHIVEEPKMAMSELWRVCKPGGKIIIPTYITHNIKSANFSIKFFNFLGAGFQQMFNYESYKEFFNSMGYEVSNYYTASGRMPCCAAIIEKK